MGAFRTNAGGMVPILDFSRPEDRVGACTQVDGNPTGLAFGCEPTADGNGLRFWTESNAASYVRFALPAIARNLARIPSSNRTSRLYLRLRANRLPNSRELNFTAQAPVGLRYQIGVPILHPGELETVPFYADLGWNRRGISFDPSSLAQADIYCVGAPDVEIYEVGFLPEKSEEPPEDIGKPHVDPDAFVFYPEPRIVRVFPTAVPLDAYGDAYACRGDVPPGAIKAFTDEMRRFYGRTYHPSDDARIVFEVAKETAIPGYEQIRFDGFALVVAPKGIRLVARDPKGLVYAAIMLADAVKMTSGDTGAPAVRLLSVIDWPRLEHRPLQDMLRTHGHADKYEIGFYTEMLERCGIGSRFNMFGFEPGAYYEWQTATNIPVRSGKAWSRREFEEVVDWINDRSMVAYPRMNGLGHVRGWPLRGRREAKLYGEDDDTTVLCTRKTAQREMTKAVFGEILDICSKNPSLAPKFFHIGYDEVRWQTDSLPMAQHCTLCAGVPKKELFLEQLLFLCDWCKSRGVRPVMCADMVRKYHSGFNQFRCAEIEPRIPKDVIYDNWVSHDMFEIEETAKAGHENWKILTEYQANPLGESFISGMGLNICTYNWWLTHGGAYGIMAQRLLADQMWRAAPRTSRGEREAKLARWGDYLIRNWSRQPIPFGTERFATIAFAGETNWTGFAQMPSVTTLSSIPIAAPVTVEATEEPKPLSVGRKAASICILHAAEFLSEENRQKFMSGAHAGHPMEGTPMVEYVVRYVDGFEERIVIRYGWNVSDWTMGEGFGGLCGAYPIGCRAVWRNGRNAASLYEWVNPHPEKEIVALDLRRTDRLVCYAVFALTVRLLREEEKE